MIPAPSGSHLRLLTLKVVKFCPFFKFFLVRHKLPFFGQNCSLPFSLWSLDIPALLKSWKKHYMDTWHSFWTKKRQKTRSRPGKKISTMHKVTTRNHSYWQEGKRQSGTWWECQRNSSLKTEILGQSETCASIYLAVIRVAWCQVMINYYDKEWKCQTM
jgi:hypothetical protein